MATSRAEGPNDTLGRVSIDWTVKSDDEYTSECKYCVWRPDRSLRLPERFELSMKCFVGRDGVKRFSTCFGIEAFIANAALAGRAILERGLTSEQRASHGVKWLIYGLRRRLREKFGRRFRRAEDLKIPSGARTSGGECDVLPSDLGLDSNGRGRKWSPAKLVERGRQSAGQDKPDDYETCIRLGLIEAARINPLNTHGMNEEEKRRLLRFYLFDLGPANEPIHGETKKLIERRFLKAIDKHLDDDTEAFDRWFFTNTDNIVHQISKSTRDGGPISRDVVRQVLLETVFGSFECVGQCVHRSMLNFLRVFPEPLNPNEIRSFQALYLANQAMGGMPLILIASNFGILRELIFEYAETGSNELLGVLLRGMQYYVEMSTRRREADRRIKENAKQRRDGTCSDSNSLNGYQERRDDDSSVLLRQVAEVLRKEHNATCSCESAEKWCAKVEESEGEPIVVNVGCESCGHTETFPVDEAAFAEIARQIQSAADSDE